MRVLVAVEGSDESWRALENTIERATEAGDEVTVAVFAKADQSLAELEASVRERLDETDLETDVIVIEEEHPPGRLVEIAETEGYDQLVIGGGNQSPMGKIEMGTITEFVVLNAKVTVRLER